MWSKLLVTQYPNSSPVLIVLLTWDMCRGSESDSINGSNIMADQDNNNNNSFFNYNPVSFQCSCMSGSRRIRKRHPATVQTPGRVQEMSESDTIEPLVSYLDSRLDSGWQRHQTTADWNENFTCDPDKPADHQTRADRFETQFVMEFTHLKMGSERPLSRDEHSTQDWTNCRLISSTKLK